jgi:hypothetical protein
VARPWWAFENRCPFLNRNKSAVTTFARLSKDTGPEMSQAEVYRSYAEASFHAARGPSDTEDRARGFGMAQHSPQWGELGQRGGSEQTLTEAMALIESAIQDLRWDDSVAVDHGFAGEAPSVKIKSWDVPVGLPVLLIASVNWSTGFCSCCSDGSAEKADKKQRFQTNHTFLNSR